MCINIKEHIGDIGFDLRYFCHFVKHIFSLQFWISFNICKKRLKIALR